MGTIVRSARRSIWLGSRKVGLRRSVSLDPSSHTSYFKSGHYLQGACNPQSGLHTLVLRTRKGLTNPPEARKTMGWQKTFTLSRRAKGCHLVTDEVVRNIRDGLKDVKVPLFVIPRIDPQMDLLNIPVRSSRLGCCSYSCSAFIRL